ncbi:S41 family peptidase [bacterium 210820-DFI.6.37]|nr:S41 family peptidase [bacterium 210820-DFI.6.37]
MNLKKQNFVILLIIVFLLGGAAAMGGVALVENGIAGGTVKVSKKEYSYYQQLDERYSKLNQLYDQVTESFYKKPSEEDLATGMYKGLVAGLGDPYSAYMTEEEYQSWSDSTLGEFDGIGVTFSTNNDGQYVVINTIPDTPAEKAGLKAGDLLLAVDGKTYETMETFSAAMKGKAGTKVTVTYERDGKQKDVTMKRATIVNVTVDSKMLEDQIGYIQISSFEEHTAEDFTTALEQMEKKKVKGLVIDLRGNGGGLVDSGLEIADQLMGKGTVTYLEDQKGEKQYLKSDAKYTELSYVLLVDENTASTSEILAAAVKDNTDNPLVGTTTFGKGIVQSSGELKDGSALKITTMQYFSPKGNVINGKGVKPDYTVKNSKDGKEDTQLEKAIELLK